MENKNKVEIRDIIERFTEGFNANNLDMVMEFFAEDAIYVELNGKENRGKADIRKAFEPQFNGYYGKMLFHHKDFFYDAEEGKALFNWWCTMELKGKILKWEGLDIFLIENGLIKEKRTFSQSDIPKFIPQKLLLIPGFLLNMLKQKMF